jgi:hypothetical protein
VFQASGREFSSLQVLWQGKSAGVQFLRYGKNVEAKIMFPNLDENSNIPSSTFNHYIGFALHELGHCWHTDNTPWDRARRRHGEFVSRLINGLEDPRIEQRVIESGHAPNARALFESLVSGVLTKDGYVESNDIKNYPFLLAIEGRRLNGYTIAVPEAVSASPHAKLLRKALHDANVAIETERIVEIAVELYEALKMAQKDAEEKGEGEGEGEGEQGEQGSQGEQGEGEQDGQGEGEGEGEGEQGKQGSQDGQGSPDEQDEQAGQGKGWDKGRRVEPDDFINSESAEHINIDEGKNPRPSIGRVEVLQFTWG